MDIEKLKGFDCPLEATLAMIGGKYKILIVYFLGTVDKSVVLWYVV